MALFSCFTMRQWCTPALFYHIVMKLLEMSHSLALLGWKDMKITLNSGKPGLFMGPQEIFTESYSPSRNFRDSGRRNKQHQAVERFVTVELSYSFGGSDFCVCATRFGYHDLIVVWLSRLSDLMGALEGIFEESSTHTRSGRASDTSASGKASLTSQVV